VATILELLVVGENSVPLNPALGSDGQQFERDVLILIPVFNDWAALGLLLQSLDGVLKEKQISVRILVVDDASTMGPADDFQAAAYRAIKSVEVLGLKRNLGHQRAIAVGLAFVEEHDKCGAVVVMDGDGEDDPADVPRLLEEFERESGRKIVFAERTRRSESVVFVFFYWLYCCLHLMLTGVAVRIGNFSVIPRDKLTSLVVLSEIWSHYPAAVVKSRLPYSSVATVRAQRLAGRSQMDFVRLVVHGLSALSVFSEVIGVRVLVLVALLALVSFGGVGVTVLIRMFTNLAIPGWATNLVGFFTVLLMLAVMFATLFSFVILNGRQATTFLPCRDYRYFIRPLKSIYSQPCPTSHTSATS
jgi:glycosyltransferase involved in cell wall biosynthesis